MIINPIFFGSGGGLPAGYQKVEWICGTGTQYIDSGIVPTANTLIITDANSQSTSGSIYEGLLEVGSPNLRLHSGTTADNSALQIWGGISSSALQSANSDTLHRFIYGNGFVALDNVGRGENEVTYNISFYLFTRHRNTGSDSWTGSIKKSMFKVFDGTSLIMDLVACYRISDGVIGMYDLIGNTFYTNSGTGTFTKGSDV